MLKNLEDEAHLKIHIPERGEDSYSQNHKCDTIRLGKVRGESHLNRVTYRARKPLCIAIKVCARMVTYNTSPPPNLSYQHERIGQRSIKLRRKSTQ